MADKTSNQRVSNQRRIEPEGKQPRVILHGRRCMVDPLVPTSKKCGYKNAIEAMGVNEGVMYMVDVTVSGCLCVFESVDVHTCMCMCACVMLEPEMESMN